MIGAISDWTNDQKAELAIELVCRATPSLCDEHMPAVTCIEDVLRCLAHACDAVGLAPAETFRDALRHYRKSLEHHPPARKRADGLNSDMMEVVCRRL